MRAASPAGQEGGFSQVVIATHHRSTGPPTELRDYLRSRVERLCYIEHPLFADGSSSKMRIYRQGDVVESREFRIMGPGPVRWGREVVASTRLVRQAAASQPFDLFVAGDNLLCLSGIQARRRGHVKHVVLYSIDYSPRRFNNPLLNRVYHRIDRFASEHADVVWNVSPQIEQARRQRDGRPGAPALVVPVGAHMRADGASPQAHLIGFMGHLLEKQGVQLALEALVDVREKVPDTGFVVIGGGPYADALKDQAARLGVAGAVEFTGFIEDHEEVERRLAECSIAVAPYVPDPDSWTNFADPGKIRTYLANGLPIVTTDVPAVAREVQSRGAGKMVSYDRAAIAGAILQLLKDPAALREARAAALAMARDFTWDRIFDNALESTERIIRGT